MSAHAISLICGPKPSLYGSRPRATKRAIRTASSLPKKHRTTRSNRDARQMVDNPSGPSSNGHDPIAAAKGAPARYAGKVAIITGSSTGIGAAIAQRLASEGASVVLSGRRVPLLNAKAAELVDKGYRAIAAPGDIATQAASVVQTALDEFGRLDVLVNNAAISAGM